MPIKPIIFFLLLFSFYSNAQEITIINSINKNTIDNVLIFNKFGKYLGKTDISGKFKKTYIENLTDFVILHPTIKMKTISSSNIVNNEIAIEQTYEQPTPKIDKNNSHKEYVVLKGFFTTYATTNGILDSYTDGIVEYVFEKKINTYKNHVIKEYRNFNYKNYNYRDYNSKNKTSLITFSGISQFPVLNNMDYLKNFKKHTYKNFNSEQNNLFIIKSSDSLNNENSKKCLGYIFNNYYYETSYKFSGDQIDLFELSNFSHTITLDAKHKKENDFKNYSSIVNFYPLEIKYLDKNEIEKGVKLNSKKSKYTSNYWQNNYFSYLIDYLSQKSLYDISFMKNEK